MLSPGLGDDAVGNSLPQEITANKREPLARSICVHVKPRPECQGHQIRRIACRLPIDQKSIAMLLGTCGSESLVKSIGNRFLGFDAAWLRVMPGDKIS